jgi:hypothetical protein
MKRYEKNPRYIALRGKPILVVGSAEHYGAVLNADFDFRPYLKTMAADGLNQCRVFSGTYRELPGEFGIVDNVLAPRPAAYLCPWKKDGERWDLAHWDERYWQRLGDFVRDANKKRILVEYVLFCHWYNDDLWKASPLHPDNNVQRVGPKDRTTVYRLERSDLWPFVEAFVRKAATVLAPFDNVYFELMNEPYTDGSFAMVEAFQNRIADVLHSAAPDKLVALNIANGTGVVASLHPHVGIVNFHYARAEALLQNAHVELVLADDETGFAGQSATPYRKEAWTFLLSGGAMFSHLDYSFTVAHPDGTAPITGKTPGYGGADLRAQLGFLRRLVEKAAPWELAPLASVSVPALTDAGYTRLIAYLERGGDLELALPQGIYRRQWHDPIACTSLPEAQIVHSGGPLTLTAPLSEAVLTLTRKKR